MRSNYSTNVLFHKGFRQNLEFFKISNLGKDPKGFHNWQWFYILKNELQANDHFNGKTFRVGVERWLRVR